MTIAEPHSCRDMDAAVADARVALIYRPRYRSLGICNVQRNEPFGEQYFTKGTMEWARNVAIYFCPWCGDTLPKPLRAEWRERLAAEGLVSLAAEGLVSLAAEGLAPADPDRPADLPERWRTDRWWRDEGL